MGQGFQTFNENGEVIIDTGTRISFTLGSIVTSGSGTIVDDRFRDGELFTIVSPLSGFMLFFPTFTVQGNVLTYTGSGTYRLIYGIY